jgi:hypothetical protein
MEAGRPQKSVQVLTVENIWIKRPPEGSLGAAHKCRSILGYQSNLTNGSFVRKQHVAASTDPLGNTLPCSVVDLGRRIEDYSSGVHVRRPNECRSLANELIGPRPVLTVVAVLDK